LRVVIADDNLLVREGIAALLRRAGLEVAAEADSPEALHRAVDAHRPDVAIVDIRIASVADGRGVRAAHAIRERHPARCWAWWPRAARTRASASGWASPSGRCRST
jgi:DNA-binding NarL/FixJ family response regulator